MNLKRALSPAVMHPALAGRDRNGAIEEMVRFLAASANIDDVDPLIEAVMERERKDSTGLEHGVAVPHGKTDAVATLIAGVGRLVQPIDYPTRDGNPVSILVMTISPQSRSGPHLEFLGEVIRLLRDPSLRSALLEADDADGMYRVFTR